LLDPIQLLMLQPVYEHMFILFEINCDHKEFLRTFLCRHLKEIIENVKDENEKVHIDSFEFFEEFLLLNHSKSK
jgi:hypothetical protein